MLLFLDMFAPAFHFHTSFFLTSSYQIVPLFRDISKTIDVRYNIEKVSHWLILFTKVSFISIVFFSIKMDNHGKDIFKEGWL